MTRSSVLTNCLPELPLPSRAFLQAAAYVSAEYSFITDRCRGIRESAPVGFDA
jgi:hypothetical protein